jgi:CHAD domain-containing protein
MNTSTPRDRLWRKRLNELSAVWPDFLSGRTTGLHKTRVASRRIREALPILGADAPPGKVKKLNRKMRALTRSLGPIRELDVELDMLNDKSRTNGAPGRALEIVRRDVASRRQVLRDELGEKAPIGDLKKLLRKLERVGEKGARHKGENEKWRGVLATRLMRRAKGLASALEDAGPVYAPERLHAVRIATKKLRYASEIAREAGVPAAAPLLRVLKRHQERLGRLHDVQILLKHIRETEGSPHVGARVNDLAGYADSLERECRRLHAGFVDHRSELALVVKDIRHQIVPALTMASRRQAHVTGAGSAARRRRAKS